MQAGMVAADFCETVKFFLNKNPVYKPLLVR